MDVIKQCCTDARVSEGQWKDRDSAAAQIQLGTAHTLLSAGCQYAIDDNSDEQSWRIRIVYRGFGWFDHHGALNEDTFYLPTECVGRDWY